MSSQGFAGEDDMFLSVARHQQQFRLLELPQELLELLSRPGAPCLSIKSTGLSKDGHDEHKFMESSAAVLCTNSKTFLLRQVQTSNSVHILQPSIHVGVDGFSTVGGATAIAQCGTIVELAPSSGSAHNVLKDLLPQWPPNGRAAPNHRKWDKRTVFSNLPFSDGELQRAWTESFAFERDGCSWTPSARDIRDVWDALLVATKAGMANLDESFDADVVWGTIRDGGTRFPREMFQAFVERFAAHNEPCEHMDMDMDMDMDRGSLLSKSYSIDRTALIRWLGAQIFTNMTNTSGNVLVKHFVAAFEDELPPTWQNEAKLEVIQDQYYLETESVMAPITKQNGNVPQSSQASTNLASSRKWHERFGKSRCM